MSKLTATDAAVPSEIRGGPSAGERPLPLGVIIRQLRGDRTLREVEKDTGIANSHLCNVERGSQQPGLKFLGRMADYYETSVAEIIRQAELLRNLQDNPDGFMAADVERSYRFVAEDPRLQPWEEPDEDLSVAAKQQVVRTYELLTGRTLLKPISNAP